MVEKPNQPREYDAVLGSQTSALPPTGGVVLGGLPGLKQRFGRFTVEEKIEALSKALTYGKPGLDFIIQTLEDNSEPVRWAAYSLLQERAEPRVQQVLQRHLPSISPGEIDCTRLGGLLAVGNWKEADRETAAILLKASGGENTGILKLKNIESLSPKFLDTINHLWLGCSNGQFGLDIQASIWQSLGGHADADYQIWYRFCDRIGWRTNNFWVPYNHLTFSLEAPKGHLPFLPIGGFGVTVCLQSLFFRLQV